MKKRKKILVITISLILIGLILNNYIYAVDTSLYGSIYSSDDSELMNIGGKILWIAQLIGYSVSVITLMIVGIQYVIKSPDEKAKIKDRLITYTIGAAILFGATSFVSILANFGIGLFK